MARSSVSNAAERQGTQQWEMAVCVFLRNTDIREVSMENKMLDQIKVYTFFILLVQIYDHIVHVISAMHS